MKKKIFGILLTLALVCSFGLMAPVPVAAQVDDGQTLNVAEWEGPTQLTNVSGRPTVLKVGSDYHMWYSPSDSAIYHTSSTEPTGFGAGTTCTFTGGTPAEVGSVTVLEEGGTFYMIAYEKSDATDATKKFAIYTSSNGDTWAYGGLVFGGAGLPAYNKIDGPYLFKDGSTYRLYFQVKTPETSPTRYDIYTAESTAASLDAIASNGDAVDFTLVGTNPVLSPGASGEWDGAFVMHPWVVKDDDGTYYMWYSAHAGGTTNQKIGLALSTDGYTWHKSPGNPILKTGTGVNDAEPSVIKDDNTWRMWYGEVSSNTVKYLTATGPFEFSSIQAAVNAASDGDTIKVAAGTYEEQVVINNKSLTLQGAGASSTTIKAPATPISYKFTESGSLWQPVVFAFGGTTVSNSGDYINISGEDTITVTISGFTIDGDDRVPGDRSAGILLRNAGGTISGNTVKNMYIDGKQTFGIAAYGDSDVTIAENNVSGYARGGIVANGDDGTQPDPNAIITDNIVTGPGMGASVTWAPNGIQIGFGATGKIIGNTVSGNGYPGTNWSGSGILVATSNGVEVYDNTVTGNQTGIGTSGVVNGTWIHGNMVDGNTFGISIQNQAVNTTIENNIITNSSYDGIDICNFASYGSPPIGTIIRGNTITANNTEDDATSGGIWVAEGVDASTVAVNFNNIVDNNQYGILNTSTTGNNGGTHTLDATNNWWGDASGPSGGVVDPITGEVANGSGDKVYGNVHFDPWIGAPTEEVVSVELTEAGGSIPDSPTGGAITVTGSGISATLVAAQYTSNPGGPHGLQAQGYYDVYLSNIAEVTSVTIEFSPALPNTVIYYWDGTAWTRCSSQSYSEGAVTVTITSATTPKLSDLVGSSGAPALYFMSATSPPIGGEAFPISPWAASAPWIALGVALAAGAGMFAWRRARA